MIQRIQSLLLFLAAVLLSVCLFTPVWKATSSIDIYFDTYLLSITNQGAIANTSTSYISILIALCIALTLLVIFKYKNRVLQMRLNMLNTFLICIIEALYYWNIKGARELLTQHYDENWGAAFFLPLGAIVLCILAGRRIQKDEALVRSVDRLR